MSAVTNFQNRSIEFSTTGTLLTNTSTQAQPVELRIGAAGKFQLCAGQQPVLWRRVNTVTTASPGNSTGRFYGPSAQEIGASAA
jgi:hypothetical protein